MKPEVTIKLCFKNHTFIDLSPVNLKSLSGKNAADEREMLVLVEEDIIRYTSEMNEIYEKVGY